MRVFVVGSVRYSENSSEEIKTISREIGKALAEHHHTILVGSDSVRDVDPYVIEGANSVAGKHDVVVYCPSQARKQGADSNKVPFAGRRNELANLHIAHHREHGPWEVAGITAIRDADAVVLVGGGATTEMVGELAPILGKPVLPIPIFSGAAEEIWHRLARLYTPKMSQTERQHITVEWELDGQSANYAVTFVEKLCADNPFRDGYSERPRNPKRILSLSGGGMRGIFQAKYLAHTAALLKHPLRECFDLIAGTSTGAIIALGIALGIDPNKIVDVFRNYGQEIFPPHIRIQSRRAWSWLKTGPRYDHGPLRRRLTETFGDAQLKDCNPPVLIAAATLDRYQTRKFMTLPHHRTQGHEDRDLFAVDVALSSAAAPLFFPAFTPRGQARTYVDGGLWANNPVLMAVMELHRRMNVPFEDMRVISVGNGEVPSGELAINFNKMRRAKMLSPILDIMFATQSELAEEAVAYLLKNEANVLHINISLKDFIELDDSKKAAEILEPLGEQCAGEQFERFQRIVTR
jgi:uncharacterized protein